METNCFNLLAVCDNYIRHNFACYNEKARLNKRIKNNNVITKRSTCYLNYNFGETCSWISDILEYLEKNEIKENERKKKEGNDEIHLEKKPWMVKLLTLQCARLFINFFTIYFTAKYLEYLFHCVTVINRNKVNF